MITYELKILETATVIRHDDTHSLSTTTYTVPIDAQGNIINAYGTYNVVDGNNIHVFDNETEYRTWIQNL